MPDWLGAILSYIKEISSRVALPAFLFSLAFFIISDNYLDSLHVLKFKNEYGFIIGIVFLFSTSVLISNISYGGYNFISPYVKQRIFIMNNSKDLKNLTGAEKEILREFIINGCAEISFPISSGVINLLERKNIIIRASTVSSSHVNFAYILQPWARDFLEKNKYILL